MSIFASVALSVLAALGVALAFLDFLRVHRAKKESFICLCFREELLYTDALPDMLIICRTDAEQEEVIRRVCDKDGRRVFIKRF